MISQRLMKPSDFLSSKAKWSLRISRIYVSMSPPSLSPVTAKSTSLESTARKLAYDPYYLTPIGTTGPCYRSCLLGSKTSLTMHSMISMTASRSFLTESNFHSNALTVCLTCAETISWNFSSSSVWSISFFVAGTLVRFFCSPSRSFDLSLDSPY